MNLLNKRRKDLEINTLELIEITNKLNYEWLEEDVEQDLERQARDKRAIKKVHLKEIRKLEAQTTISVDYRIVETGLTAVFPPGLICQPKFLSAPICWCPYNTPACKEVKKTTMRVIEIPLSRTCPQHTTANGVGLRNFFPNQKSKFVIAAKNSKGKPLYIGGDTFIVDSKEVDIKSSISDKENGKYEVSYFAEDVKDAHQFFLDVTLHGLPIFGSPFSVNCPRLLLEFSSKDDPSKDWLDAAVATMSNIRRAELWLNLYDVKGSEFYKTTGVSSHRWTKEHITSPGKQLYDIEHTNAIRLNNGDRLMIIGKQSTDTWEYRPYNIIINAGWDKSKIRSFQHPRRMIITATDAPQVTGWTAPDNRISFSSTGFFSTNGNWPKFNGTFRIYYSPLDIF
jgi:hypothetical protein